MDQRGRFEPAGDLGAEGRQTATAVAATTAAGSELELDIDRAAFAAGLLACCVEDLPAAKRRRFWAAYAEACAVEATGAGELAHGRLGDAVDRVSSALQGTLRERGRDLTGRRIEERIELGLELDSSSTGRIRLARQVASQLMLTPAEEVAAALTLAAGARDSPASKLGTTPPPVISRLELDDDDDLELEALDAALARLADPDDDLP